MMQPSSGASSQGSETEGYDAHHVYDDWNEEVEVEDATPNEELQTLTTNERVVFNAAHHQMMMVGYERVTHQEQCGIVEGLLSEMNLMVYDDDEMPEMEHLSDSDSDDGDKVCRMKPPSNSESINHPRDSTEQSSNSQSSYTSQHSEDEILAASGDDWPADLRNDVVPQVPSSHKESYSLETTADTLNLILLSSAKVTSTLLITLVGRGMSAEQICAIYGTGASKPFAKAVKECIKGILIQLLKASCVTTTMSNATAASMPLRRYNFAITTEMREEAQRYDIDFEDAYVITLLAAPLVCANFQHDFGIVP